MTLNHTKLPNVKSKLFDILMAFLIFFYKKVDVEKRNLQTTLNNTKLPSRQRVNKHQLTSRERTDGLKKFVGSSYLS